MNAIRTRSPAAGASPPGATSATDPRTDERGVALVLGLLFTIIVVGITVAGAMFLKAHQEKTRTNFVSHGQAMQFARSGLIEGLGWLRKQTAQPVLQFQPVLNPAASPPILDTMDPAVGIVREFEITESVWGRYEVWRDWPGDPDPQRLAWRNQMRCLDISSQRGDLSPGSVWRLRSVGYVFRRVDPAHAFDEPPNRVLGIELVDVEARRLALQPPGQAALCTRFANTCRVLTKGRIQGTSAGAGIYYATGSGTVTISGTGASVTGTPGLAAAPSYADDTTAVFGVTVDELRSIADHLIANPAEFPRPVPIDSIVVVDSAITFDAARPLLGTGIVVVLGNATVAAGSNSSFSGLLYVQGNLVLREPSEIQGAVIVTGSVTVQGSSDYATIVYDDTILNHLRQEVGTYRLSSSVSRPMVGDR